MQLVNRNCVICKERISSQPTAKFCDECGNPVHRACLEDAKPFEEASITTQEDDGTLLVPVIDGVMIKPFDGTERCKVCGGALVNDLGPRMEGDPTSLSKRRVHGILTVPGIVVLLLFGGIGAGLMQLDISGYRPGWILFGITMAIGAVIADRCFGFEVTVRGSSPKK